MANGSLRVNVRTYEHSKHVMLRAPVVPLTDVHHVILEQTRHTCTYMHTHVVNARTYTVSTVSTYTYTVHGVHCTLQHSHVHTHSTIQNKAIHLFYLVFLSPVRPPFPSTVCFLLPFHQLDTPLQNICTAPELRP